jgi:hypothetical protein
MLAGCSGGDDDSGSGGSAVDAGPLDIKCPDDLPAFTATRDTGLEADAVTHHSLRVRVIHAAPARPERKVDSDWTIQFMDPKGDPIDDVEIASVCMRMPPPHSHFSAPLDPTTKLTDPGQFGLNTMHFNMRGVWEIQIVTNRNGASRDAADDMDASTEAEPEEFTYCDMGHDHPGTEMAKFHVCVAN